MSGRVTRIEEVLSRAFAPLHLSVIDDSHLHRGHAGAATGKGHFKVRIVAAAFADKSPVARHRLVYEALAALLETDIHALSIEAFTPDERPG